jgi:hypothetical protein
MHRDRSSSDFCVGKGIKAFWSTISGFIVFHYQHFWKFGGGGSYVDPLTPPPLYIYAKGFDLALGTMQLWLVRQSMVGVANRYLKRVKIWLKNHWRAIILTNTLVGNGVMCRVIAIGDSSSCVLWMYFLVY